MEFDGRVAGVEAGFQRVDHPRFDIEKDDLPAGPREKLRDEGAANVTRPILNEFLHSSAALTSSVNELAFLAGRSSSGGACN